MKKFFKKGSGEILAFICVSPFIVIIFFIVCYIIQDTSLYNRMQYATYVAARTASVSGSWNDAENAAQESAEMNMGQYADLYDSLDVQLQLVKGSGYSTTKKSSKKSSATKFIKNKKDGWQKGNYVMVTLKADGVHGIGAITGRNASKEYTMTMAIENGFDYVTDDD